MPTPKTSLSSRCPTCGRKHRRGNPANSRYWLLLHRISERLPVQGETFSAEQWHEYAKSKWIGCDDIRLPNGRVIPRPRSSADLDSAAFADYMTALEVWAGEHDVYLDDMEGT